MNIVQIDDINMPVICICKKRIHFEFITAITIYWKQFFFFHFFSRKKIRDLSLNRTLIKTIKSNIVKTNFPETDPVCAGNIKRNSNSARRTTSEIQSENVGVCTPSRRLGRPDVKYIAVVFYFKFTNRHIIPGRTWLVKSYPSGKTMSEMGRGQLSQKKKKNPPMKFPLFTTD